MVGEAADGNPLAPTFGRLPHLLLGVGERRRCRQVGPPQRDELLVALAVHLQLDHAADAFHGAQQDVLGVPIHRRTAMRLGPLVGVVPRTEHERVANDQPARLGLPGGFQNHAAGQVAARSWDLLPVRTDPEMSGTAVQDGAEHAGGVRSRHTQPFHRPR